MTDPQELTSIAKSELAALTSIAQSLEGILLCLGCLSLIMIAFLLLTFG